MGLPIVATSLPNCSCKHLHLSLNGLESKLTCWRRTVFMAADTEREIRVCVNRACSKSGSRDTLKYFISMASPDLKVNSCGCLGRCGSGPNLVVLPEEIFASHCSTASQVAHFLANHCGVSEPENNLAALLLKEQANQEFERGNAASALQLYTKAINLKPSGGLHYLHANRSVVRLALGDNSGSLADAIESSNIAPNWHVAFLRQGDAYFALENFEAAEHAYSRALAIDPSLRTSKTFNKKIQSLQERYALQ